jgi:hypothetical protein
MFSFYIPSKQSTEIDGKDILQDFEWNSQSGLLLIGRFDELERKPSYFKSYKFPGRSTIKKKHLEISTKSEDRNINLSDNKGVLIPI